MLPALVAFAAPNSVTVALYTPLKWVADLHQLVMVIRPFGFERSLRKLCKAILLLGFAVLMAYRWPAHCWSYWHQHRSGIS
jgi:hypothetical protein